jgi:hypothetical protein
MRSDDLTTNIVGHRVSRAGAMVPVDWSGVLVRRDEVPVPRLLDCMSDLPAFPESGESLRLSEQAFVASFSASDWPRGFHQPFVQP